MRKMVLHFESGQTPNYSITDARQAARLNGRILIDSGAGEHVIALGDLIDPIPAAFKNARQRICKRPVANMFCGRRRSSTSSRWAKIMKDTSFRVRSAF